MSYYFCFDIFSYNVTLEKKQKLWYEDYDLPDDVRNSPETYLDPGDYVIVSRKDKYYHHAIYSGNNKIIHVRRPTSEIKEDEWEVFYGEDGQKSVCKRIFIFREKERNKNEVLDCARSLIGPIQDKYNLFKRNCRHFAHYCATESFVGNEIHNHSLNFIHKYYLLFLYLLSFINYYIPLFYINSYIRLIDVTCNLLVISIGIFLSQKVKYLFNFVFLSLFSKIIYILLHSFINGIFMIMILIINIVDAEYQLNQIYVTLFNFFYIFYQFATLNLF
jgi:hypothetical protein